MNVPNVDYHILNAIAWFDQFVRTNPYFLALIVSFLTWLAPRTKTKVDDWILAKLKRKP